MPTEKPTVLAGDDLLANHSVQPDVKPSLTSESEISNNRRIMEKRESVTEDPPMPTEKPTVLAPGDDLLANPSVQPDVKLSLTSESKIPNNKSKLGKQKSGTNEPLMQTEKPTVISPGDDLPANPSVQPDVKVPSMSKSKIPKNKRKRWGDENQALRSHCCQLKQTLLFNQMRSYLLCRNPRSLITKGSGGTKVGHQRAANAYQKAYCSCSWR
ncbi:zonadhesin-like [Hibiscus syriacus]|uniref:zonadhesin-like n=1 Tax=Hibiscus syriacus TaxID=106335 RepID=UPI001920CFB3|nr:zonadhesin-like [Hibiscus syriacus]